MKFLHLMAAACAVAAFVPASAQIPNVDVRGLAQSWDKVLPAEPATGVCPNWSPRFTCVMNNAAIRDNETGLVWPHPLQARMKWYDAKLACLNLSVGNRQGWRLPTVTELASLIDTSNPGPVKLPTAMPFILPRNYTDFWTSTQLPHDLTVTDYTSTHTYVYGVRFSYAGQLNFTTVTQELTGNLSHQVWCVRGGEATGGTH